MSGWPQILFFALVPATAQAAPPSERIEIRFADQLRLEDLTLSGQRASRRVDFVLEAGAKPLPGASLTIVYDHSPDLDPERSFLSVALNHGILRSVRLDLRDGSAAELSIPLPEGMLRPANQLVITAEQAAPDEGRAWTRVLARSWLSVPYERTRVEWTLADLPAPLLTASGYSSRRLSVLLPKAASGPTLEGLARAVAGLCRRVAPEPVAAVFVTAASEARSPLLVVGTPREQPELALLGLPAPFRITRARGEPAVAQDGRPLESTVGVIALATTGEQPALVVTGNTPEAVSRAVRGLDSGEAAAETARLVTGFVQEPARGPREWDGFVPPRSRFRLAEAGDSQAELAVTRETPARVRLRTTPDARFLPYGNAVKLIFRILPGFAEDPEGVVEVYWNDTLLRHSPLRALGRGPYASLSLRIPVEILRHDNALAVAWNGRTGAPGPFAMLLPESELWLPREFAARLPDLRFLRHSLFPLSVRGDLADTVVVLPDGAGDRAGDEWVAALCELSASFGRLMPSPPRFGVRRVSELGPLGTGANLVLLETAQRGAAPQLPIPKLAGQPHGASAARLPLLELRHSPWNAEKYVLRVRAPSTTLLRAAVRSLSQPAVLERLSGDTALLAAEGPLCYTLRPQRDVAEVSRLRRLEAWLRDNWLALPAILALVSGLLYMGLRLTLEPGRAAREAAGVSQRRA